MPSDVPATSNQRIDPAFVAAIAREVIARLKATSKTNQTAASIHDRIVTLNIIEQLIGTPTQAFITPHAIVTPAARDEARRRGITIIPTVDLPTNQQPSHEKLDITDPAKPERAEAMRTQLARRSVADGPAKIVLSDTPAREVYQQCTSGRETAVMIASISEVDRFADELAPTVWVLDMKRLNFASAVNVVTRILQK